MFDPHDGTQALESCREFRAFSLWLAALRYGCLLMQSVDVSGRRAGQFRDRSKQMTTRRCFVVHWWGWRH